MFLCTLLLPAVALTCLRQVQLHFIVNQSSSQSHQKQVTREWYILLILILSPADRVSFNLKTETINGVSAVFAAAVY